MPSKRGWLLLSPLLLVLLVYALRHVIASPDAVGMAGTTHSAERLQWFRDESWLSERGERVLTQSIFDEILRMIDSSESFVLLDMFLFNDWQGPVPEQHRALSSELTSSLVQRLNRDPDVTVIVISDPINTVYGGLESQTFVRLEQAGAAVVLTDLTELQDSNPVYSALWRVLLAPWGNSSGGALPNPLGPGTVTLRSWLTLLNFKANHRKLIITDQPDGGLRALITSANPHDGSSAHRNIALRFEGSAVDDLLASERAVLELSGAQAAVRALDRVPRIPTAESGSPIQVRILGESAIRDAVIDGLQDAKRGDDVVLSMFYLSHRAIIDALIAAATRGVKVRALLDVNSDAFGRKKNGVPNVPVASELMRSGVSVRWCATRGEQCHEKSLLLRQDERITLITGSGNFTRRNLDDYNLEMDVKLSGPAEHPLLAGRLTDFDRQWNNTHDRTYSLPYETHANDSLWLKIQYRFMEATGLGTF